MNVRFAELTSCIHVLPNMTRASITVIINHDLAGGDIQLLALDDKHLDKANDIVNLINSGKHYCLINALNSLVRH